MERDVDNEEREDDKEEDEEEEDEEEEEEEEDKDEKEDKDEDDGKEPRTIGQGELVNTSEDKVDTMVDDQPIMLPEQCKEMHEHTPQPQPPAPAQWPHTVEPHPRPPTLKMYPISGLEHLGRVTPQEHHLAVPTLREVEAARNTSDENMDQQLLGE